MELRGWDYSGRNIGSELHRQFCVMIDCLSDPSFTNHAAWGTYIQQRLAEQMQMTSAGAVRTVKSVCTNFGFLEEKSFGGRNEIDTCALLTKRGKLVYQTTKLKEQIADASNYNDEFKEKIYAEVKALYEEAYCDALRFFCFKNNDGSKLHPLRAALRALNKYGRMDKWEWYLFNTCIRHDDNESEEAMLDDYITRYRSGEFDFTMRDVTEKPKGHQYIPQYFEFAGLLNVIRQPKWSICDSELHADVKAEVLEADFLDKLYGGGLKMDDSKIRNTMDNLNQLLGYAVPERNENVSGEIGIDMDHCERKTGGVNVLLYGVPGCGKSQAIRNEYCKDENRIERIVFHPDYTHSDFIGQILPSVSANNRVRYVFTPGPFTRLLGKAYANPNTEYFLVIEEINRGNAPAVFGEVFQLLDRKSNADDSEFPIGTSEYSITNTDIAAYVYKNPEHKVRIPSNMSIIGTMNTSDQNVFTLDTAFQRRWHMRMIENSFEKHPYADKMILDTKVTWKKFCETVNKLILDNNASMTSSEDKQLGAYFVGETELRYDPAAEDPNASVRDRNSARRNNGRFPEKVIKYLWDDAFKFSRENIFEISSYKSLEAIIKKFSAETGNERFGFFKEGIFKAITGQEAEE